MSEDGKVKAVGALEALLLGAGAVMPRNDLANLTRVVVHSMAPSLPFTSIRQGRDYPGVVSENRCCRNTCLLKALALLLPPTRKT